jgi:hypothetical protein
MIITRPRATNFLLRRPPRRTRAFSTLQMRRRSFFRCEPIRPAQILVRFNEHAFADFEGSGFLKWYSAEQH